MARDTSRSLRRTLAGWLSAVLTAALLVPLAPGPAQAGTAPMTISGAACHDESYLGFYGYWHLSTHHDCLKIDASTALTPSVGTAFLEAHGDDDNGDPVTTYVSMTLDCLVVERIDADSTVTYASGYDDSDSSRRYSIFVADYDFAVGLPHQEGGLPCQVRRPEYSYSSYFTGDFVAATGSELDGNSKPAAAFTSSCDVLTCTFDASASTDPDGSVASYRWSLGDGTVGQGQTFTHTYGTAGVWNVNLTVVDDDSYTDYAYDHVKAGGYPTAVVSFTCKDLTCDFDGSASSDPNGTIASYEWRLSDGTSLTGAQVRHTFAAGGDYYAWLNVIDDDGLLSQAHTGTFTLTAPPYTLSGSVSRKGQRSSVNLTWSGALTAAVRIYRDAVLIATTPNDGSHTDAVRVGGTYSYRVCDDNETWRCSNSITVST